MRPLQSLRFVDLFAGIGGFHLALNELGAECVFASDVDPECRLMYRRAFGFESAGDIAAFTEGQHRVSVPDHEILCAGFPCQPFSKSGFQRGINETRGTLFYSILRILEDKRPGIVLLENVRNLAGPRHRDTWATIVRQLRALGYRVPDLPTVFSPHLLPPWMGGRPQVRERVFIPAQYAGEGLPPEDLVMAPPVRNRPVGGWDPLRWRVEDYLQPESEVDHSKYGLRLKEIEWLDTWNDLIQSLDSIPLPGFPIWLDEFRLTPQVAPDEPAWKVGFKVKNSKFYRDNQSTIDAWMRRHPNLAQFPETRRKFEWQAQAAPRDVWELLIHLRPSGIRVKRPTYIPALVAITQTSIVGSRRRRLTPREAARLQGFPDSFPLHPDDAVSYRQLGNAVNVGVVQHVAQAAFVTTAGTVADRLAIAS